VDQWIEAGRMGRAAADPEGASGVRLRAERRMAPTGSRLTAARAAGGIRSTWREWPRDSG
jgi:hypothetical protein